MAAIRWVTVINIDTMPVPAYGLLGVQGVDPLTGNLQVARPTQNSLVARKVGAC